MDEKARELAQAFVDDGRDSFVARYPVRANGQATGRYVVVFVGQMDARVEKSVGELRESFKAIAMPSGTPCPRCGGTGYI